MKSQVDALLLVMQGLFKDVLAVYPSMRVDLLRDSQRVSLTSQTRGIGFFCLDLPHLESLLLKGLESGRLALDGPASRCVSPEIRVPRLFRGLWLRVFEKDGCLKQEPDVNSVFFLRQFLVLGKKLELGCSHDRIQSVVGAYHDIEQGLRRASLGWDSDFLFKEEEVHQTETRKGFGGCPDLFGSGHPGGDYNPVSQRTLDLWEAGIDGHVLPLPEETFPSASCLSLAQAMDHPLTTLPLFSKENNDENANRNGNVLLQRLQLVADIVVGSFEYFDPVAFASDRETECRGIGFRHGPGAVAERLKNHEKSSFPSWSAKLEGTYPFDFCGKTAKDDRIRPRNHEVASRLICVPKTRKGPRLIAAEPVAHQWCQQSVLSFLFDQCRTTFVSDFLDFRKQSLSGDMVLQASLDRSLATVDLSDASDRLSCWVVERVFRSNKSILRALHAARTRFLRDDISEDKGFLKLKKFASQGTATTFPVMSLVMTCIAITASLEWHAPITISSIRKLRGKVRVFGDDIIIPRTGYARLELLMNLLQLKINKDKSYVEGQFRESCGVDGFRGNDITPVKPSTLVADSPTSVQSLVDASNNLFSKGFWNAAEACSGLIPFAIRSKIRVRDFVEAGSCGFSSFSGGYELHLKTRWNSNLHRSEVRVWGLVPHSRKLHRDGYEPLLEFFSSTHSEVNPRIVSTYGDNRKTKGGLRWEPAYVS